MSCYISTGCFQTRDLHEIVALASDNGFGLELSSSLSYAPDILEPIFKAKSRVGFLIHNYFPPPAVPFVLNLASSDPEIHSKSFNLCLEAIGLCADLGLPYYSVHAGFAMEMNPELLGQPHLQGQACGAAMPDRGKAYQTFVETIRKLAVVSDEKKVGLLVENNVLAVEHIAPDGTFPLLLADADEIKTFFSDLCRPEVGLLLDVGHAKVSAGTLQVSSQSYFNKLEPFIRGLHLSDNDGRRDSNHPVNAHSWFVPYLKAFAHVPMVVEVYNCTLAEILKQQSVVTDLCS